MFMKFHLLLIGLFLVFIGKAQDDVFTKKFGPNELKGDLEVLISDLKACHPGLYEYTTPEVIDSLVVAFRQGLTDSLTQEEFHVRVRKFLRVVGCGHTSAKPSAEWYSALKGNTSAIPIHVLVQGDQLFVKKAFDEKLDNLKGARIVSIDGVPAKEVLSELKSLIVRDGVGEALVVRNIERLFQTYYLFAYGMHDDYRIELEDHIGEIVTVFVQGKTPKGYSLQKKHELIDVLKVPKAEFGFIDSSRNAAVLDLNSFPSTKFKKFYRKSFKRLAENGTETLIIDLRGNGGGYFPNGNQLMRYLMDEQFTMDFDRPKQQAKRSRHVKTNLPGKLTRFLFMTIPDRNREDPDRNYQIRFKPLKKNHFNGQVYIITDGWTFSTASFVTSKLKNAGRATTVGAETGGGEVAFNAVLSWNLSLPFTELRVSLPMYHVDIQPNMEDVGSGVMPVIPVEYGTIQQRLEGIDLEMEEILQILNGE